MHGKICDNCEFNGESLTKTLDPLSGSGATEHRSFWVWNSRFYISHLHPIAFYHPHVRGC